MHNLSGTSTGQSAAQNGTVKQKASDGGHDDANSWSQNLRRDPTALQLGGPTLPAGNGGLSMQQIREFNPRRSLLKRHSVSDVISG